MTGQSLQVLMRRLRRAAGPPGGGALTDGQLLDRWVSSRDEGAFELLLWRHGPMVLAACRRLLRDAHLADDAFQATWLIFLRKAGSVRQGGAVGAWLHRVACRVALRARAAAARRAHREGNEVDVPAPAGVDEASERDLRAVLDEEIDRLPEHYRRAFVLCCLQEKTHAEAARELGRAQGTVSAWLARARERLRARLARRGVTLTAGGLGVGLTAGAASAGVPAALVNSVVQAATVAEVVSARACAFAEEVLQAMRITKVKIALTTLVLVLGCATGLITYQGQAQPPAGAGAGSAPNQAPRFAPAPVAQPGGLPGAPQVAPVKIAYPRPWQYKALSRSGVSGLGDKAPKEVDRLAAGLTRLSAEGWELFAIDPGLQNRESTYLFRRPAGMPMGAPGAAPPVPGLPGGAPGGPGGGTGVAPGGAPAGGAAPAGGGGGEFSSAP